MSEVRYLSESTSAGNDHVVPLRSAAAVVQQENHPPAAAIGPQPGYNLPDTCGRQILTDSLIPSPTQMITRHARSAVANTQTTYVHMGCGLRVITRVNIGHKELEYGHFHNPNNAHNANTLRHGSSSNQRPPTVGDTLTVTQREVRFSFHDRRMSEEQQIFNFSASYTRRGGIMSPDKLMFSRRVSRDDTGMQLLAYSQKWVEARFSRYNTWHSEYQVESRVGVGRPKGGSEVPARTGGGYYAAGQPSASEPQGGHGCRAVHCRCGAGRDCHRCCQIIPLHADTPERTAVVYRPTQENMFNRGSDTTNTNSKVSFASTPASDPWLVISNFLRTLSCQPGVSQAADGPASAHGESGPSGGWENTSDHGSDTTNTNNKVSFASRPASDSWLEICNILRMLSSQPGVSQATGGPATALGGSSPSGGRGEGRRVEQPGEDSGEARDSHHTDAHQEGLGADRRTTEACRGGQKRHHRLSELSAPAAKKQHMDRL